MNFHFSDGKAKCEEGEISFSVDPVCEHCGELEAYDAIISDGGTWWCVACTECNGGDLPKDIAKKIAVKEKEMKIAYFDRKKAELLKRDDVVTEKWSN